MELQRSVEQKIKESNELLQGSLESNDQTREEIRKENEKLVEQFLLETQKLDQEFSGRLQAETSKLSRQLRQLQFDKGRELTTVQKRFQGIISEFDARLEQQSLSNHEVTGELFSKIVEVRS
jgi:hypothetical protein